MIIKDLHIKLNDKFPDNILNRQYIHEIIRDNNITRKVAVLIGTGTESKMWNFLKHDLQFDSLIVADMRSAKSVVSTMRSVNEQEVKAWRDHPGTLFIFVYFAG